jgi:ubiquinone/menaquinone biosynthesis C-methylase UbiE
MATHVCPWWVGYLLASPIRRWMQNPEELLRPYLWSGIRVLEPGPGMGFFTLPVAQMIGESGRVIAVDIQPKMLSSLRRRATKAVVSQRVETRLAKPDSLGIEDLAGSIDLVLAIAVVHEMPSAETFFREAAASLKAGGRLLLVEPAGHVKLDIFARELEYAQRFELVEKGRPEVRRCLAALFAKEA